MKGILKAVVLAAGVMGLVGCGTLQLNHIITGTECATKEDCIKDLHLNNPANPDITFVVEPLLMDEKPKAPAGSPAFDCPVWHGDVELCVASALKTEFPEASITFDPTTNSTPIYIKLNKVRAQCVAFSGTYMTLDYDIILNGKTIPQNAKTETGAFWHTCSGIAKEKYPEVCQIIAKQVKEVLVSKRVRIQQ